MSNREDRSVSRGLASGGAAVLAVLTLSGAAVQPPAFEIIGTMPGPVDLVELRDGLAYVSADKEFVVYDLADPAQPVRLGAHTFPEQIWGFRLIGDRAYVGANFFGLGILDLSERGRPALLGSYRSLGQTKIGAVVGGTAALIDHMEGLVFVDVSDESAPAQIGSFYLDGYARDVVTTGSMAYAVDSPTGLYVFELSGAGPWEPVGVLHEPQSPQRSLEVFDLPAGTRVLVGIGSGGLQVFDVTDPAAPAKLSAYDTPGQAGGVAIQGNRAYVADGDAGLQIVDLADPTSPTLVGGFPLPRPARDVAVAGSLIAVVVGDTEYGGHDRELVLLRQTS